MTINGRFFGNRHSDAGFQSFLTRAIDLVGHEASSLNVAPIAQIRGSCGIRPMAYGPPSSQQQSSAGY
ncbi:MAG: hypothetical protein ACI93T_001666 [Porticoccaceae bacterium]|jgi:hypothetical protein